SDSLVCDPMCGSGTLIIESAMKALNIAPGLMRRFAMEKWGCFPRGIMQEVRDEAKSLIKKDAPFEGIAYDIDPAAIQLTKENAAKAHVASRIRVMQQDIIKFKPEDLPMVGHKKAITLCNPPYGERLLDVQEAEKLYQKMGVVFKPLKDHGYYIITPHEEFEKVFERKADKKRKLYNGMLKCQLYMYFR
ncbi:MAG: class I SAM-dependent RNA methyltransferase, partial [Firmicutes bacterium]|nr:class I SAM-dependent RNA methyltransferase [Bacillota bacterium]